MKMKIEDSMARVMPERTGVIEFKNSINILMPDGTKTLFRITLNPDYSITISGGEECEVDGVILDGNFTIQPLAFNEVALLKNERPGPKQPKEKKDGNN